MKRRNTFPITEIVVRVKYHASVKTEFPWWLSGKDSACSAGAAKDAGLIPGWGRFPEEEMATHSSILAWRIPWTEEPGGLRSTGLQTVRSD